MAVVIGRPTDVRVGFRLNEPFIPFGIWVSNYIPIPPIIQLNRSLAATMNVLIYRLGARNRPRQLKDPASRDALCSGVFLVLSLTHRVEIHSRPYRSGSHDVGDGHDDCDRRPRIARDNMIRIHRFRFGPSGGSLNGATISDGTLELMSGGSAGGAPIAFASGGTLILDASQTFSGTVAGFAKPDFIDLRDVAFGSATTLSFTEAASNTSGTLAVSGGVHTANVTLLGQYTASPFTKASDGLGGTLVSDPPIVAQTDAGPAVLVNPHQT